MAKPVTVERKDHDVQVDGRVYLFLLLSRALSAKFCHALSCSHTRSTRFESGNCVKPQDRSPRSCHEVGQLRPVFCQYADNAFQLTYVHLSLPTYIKILTLSNTFTS